MNWNQIEGQWNEFKGKVKEQWGKLTDDEHVRSPTAFLLGKEGLCPAISI